MSDATNVDVPTDPLADVDYRTATEDALRLITAFLRIKDAQVRAEVLAIAERLVANGA
ncbi:hypothetical protein JQ561_26565 [Bradyrhizobium diazoefficiens]|uniref:hypothetical protein n=1 Tax=Bradyrhizobium sp. WYCCWR 12699 TaxID=3064203 RepID=UPI001BAB14BD|nr:MULTISPECIES: hypothetical protein [Bradyrhizobium]MBR0930186.1 hypothetical protein [Bradyrhizobium diazoefficiens]MDT4742458.1 hypothetical protein [Bradyrhizobium sp. WYCCWR 12699]